MKITDKKIAYIKDDYEDSYLEQKKEILESDEYILFQWHTIQKIWSKYQTLQAFTNAEFCVSYLENKLIGNATGWKENTVSLYQINENECWEFVNIYPISLKNDTLYFMLKQKQDKNSLSEISKSDALHYTKHMDGKTKHLVYR